MRTAFFEALKKHARQDKNVILMTADLAPRYFRDFQKTNPQQFINAGIAEANMIGVAAGLALAGKNVYCYSIIPFLTMRAFEQIRVDLCSHNLNVKLLGAGGGLAYGLEGMTHHAIEDIALMRALPNMTIVAPADIYEAQALAKESFSHQGPLYIRFGREGNPTVHKKVPRFKIGKGIIIHQGRDICLIAAGAILFEAKQTAELLRKKGLKPTLISLPTVKPLDRKLIGQCAQKYQAIFTLEEHSLIGGLGSTVNDVLSDFNYQGQFRKIALPDHYCSLVGKPDYLLEKSGLSPQKMAQFILKNFLSL